MNKECITNLKFFVWSKSEVIAVANTKELALMISEQVPQSEVLDESGKKITYKM